MEESFDKMDSFLYWLVAVGLRLWGFGGVAMHVAYFVDTPGEFAGSAETTAHREAHAEYIANIPSWAIAIGIGAAVSRMLGAVGLLLRRRWALQFYIAATVLFMIALYRAFVTAGVAGVMSGVHIAVEVVFAALSVFAVWFTYDSKSKGVSRQRRRRAAGLDGSASRSYVRPTFTTSIGVVRRCFLLSAGRRATAPGWLLDGEACEGAEILSHRENRCRLAVLSNVRGTVPCADLLKQLLANRCRVPPRSVAHE